MLLLGAGVAVAMSNVPTAPASTAASVTNAGSIVPLVPLGLPTGAVPSPTDAPSASSSPSQIDDRGAAFVGITSTRVADTRNESADPGVGAGQALKVSLDGVVPPDATVVSLSVTADRSAGPGFLAVSPDGTADVASLGIPSAGWTGANSVVAKISPDHTISVYASVATDVIVDVAGYWIPAPQGSSSGRYVPIEAQRALDTRLSQDPVTAGGSRAVGPTSFGVPAEASAAVVSITALDAASSGYLSVFPFGALPPDASIMNFAGGDSRTVQAIVPLGADGRIAIYSSSQTHLIVDVVGYFTGSSAPISSSGLLLAVDAQHLFDSRTDGAGQAEPDAVRRFALSEFISHTTPLSVAANITLVGATRDTWASVWARSSAPRSNTVTVIAGNNDPSTSNAAFIPLEANGQFSMYFSAGSHYAIDAEGFFLP